MLEASQSVAVHPLSIQYLLENNFSVTGLESQSWDDFADFNPDLIITVCDKAAGEVCPVWFGQSIQVHWGLKDPSKIEGSEQDIAAGFQEAIDEISLRAQALLALDLDVLDPMSLKRAMLNFGGHLVDRLTF